MIKKGILALYCAFLHILVQGSTRVIVHNNTQYTFLVQSHYDETCTFEKKAISIPAMHRKELLWIGNPSSSAASEHVFKSILHSQDLTIALQQKISVSQGRFFNKNTFFYGASSPENPIIWHSDINNSHEILITTKESPIIITFKKYDSGYGNTIVEYVFHEKHAINLSQEANNLNVLLWNVCMPPNDIMKNGQTQRSRPMVHVLQGYDVLILCELCDLPARTYMIQELKKEYPYTIMLNGPQPYKRTLKDGKNKNGGIVILSKWPIVNHDQELFENIILENDLESAKGILYARINKLDTHYNIFGTYMQAWPSNKAALVRHKQLQKIKNFIEKQDISKEEPIIIGGDFNINKYKSSLDNRAISEYQEMLTILGGKNPEHKGHPYSVDPSINKLVRRIDPKEYTDHMLFSKQHKLPKTATTTTRMLKSDIPWQERSKEPVWDLSTHFAIHGNFSY